MSGRVSFPECLSPFECSYEAGVLARAVVLTIEPKTGVTVDTLVRAQLSDCCDCGHTMRAHLRSLLARPRTVAQSGVKNKQWLRSAVARSGANRRGVVVMGCPGSSTLLTTSGECFCEYERKPGRCLT